MLSVLILSSFLVGPALAQESDFDRAAIIAKMRELPSLAKLIPDPAKNPWISSGELLPIDINAALDAILADPTVAPLVRAATTLYEAKIEVSDEVIDTLWAHRTVTGSQQEKEALWRFQGSDLFQGDGPGLLTLGDLHAAVVIHTFYQARDLLARKPGHSLTLTPGEIAGTPSPQWTEAPQLRELCRQHTLAHRLLNHVDPILIPALVSLRRILRVSAPDLRFPIGLPALDPAAISEFFVKLTRGLPGYEAEMFDSKGELLPKGDLLALGEALGSRPLSPAPGEFLGITMAVIQARRVWDSWATLAGSGPEIAFTLPAQGGIDFNYSDFSNFVAANTAFDLPAQSFVWDARGQVLWNETRGQRAIRINTEPVASLDAAGNSKFFRELSSLVGPLRSLPPDSQDRLLEIFPSLADFFSYPKTPAHVLDPWTQKADPTQGVEWRDLRLSVLDSPLLEPLLDPYRAALRDALRTSKEALEMEAAAQDQLAAPIQAQIDQLVSEIRALSADKPDEAKLIAEKTTLAQKLSESLKPLQTAQEALEEFEEKYTEGPMLELYRHTYGRPSRLMGREAQVLGQLRARIGNARALEILAFFASSKALGRFDLDGGGIGETDANLVAGASALIARGRRN